MGRRFIGIDRVEKYAEMARERVAHTAIDGGPMLLVSIPKQQGRSALEATWKSLQASTRSEKSYETHRAGKPNS
jgi:hypothetical protein